MKHARKDYDRIQDPAGLIPEEEPVFLVRGQDLVGSLTVQAWAELNEKAGGSKALSESARKHAQKMGVWLRKKLADAPDDVL